MQFRELLENENLTTDFSEGYSWAITNEAVIIAQIIES